MMIEYLKFGWVGLCFLTACASFFRCAARRDWAFLAFALGFTLWADYYLILRNNQLMGVVIFCFAHVAYIMRVNDNRRVRLFLPVAVLAALFGAFFLPFPALLLHSVIYMALFIANIVLHLRWFKNNTRLPRRNLTLALAGILLFALCDINVLLYNLPRLFPAMMPVRDAAYILLWVFYLPSQGLLAVSAFKSFKKEVQL